MDRIKLLEERKKIIMDLKAKLNMVGKPEDSIFYYHLNEDHVVLSHALFWMMSKPLASKMPHHKCFSLLRQYQEEMLEAYLTESGDFAELLDSCNTLYNILSFAVQAVVPAGRIERLSRKLQAIAVVSAGFGGDMLTADACQLLDDMDFNRYGKVVCPEIERMIPMLNRMVEEEVLYMD